jgi:hypothetical protein
MHFKMRAITPRYSEMKSVIDIIRATLIVF